MLIWEVKVTTVEEEEEAVVVGTSERSACSSMVLEITSQIHGMTEIPSGTVRSRTTGVPLAVVSTVTAKIRTS